MTFGDAIDLSSENRSADLHAVKAAGITLVGIRATIGLGTRDARVVERANACREAGLDFFLYGDDFPRHLREQDAEKQALELCDLHQATGATCVPAQDIEPEGVPATGAEWRVAVDAYAAVLTAEIGKPPISYTGPGFWSQYRELLEDGWMAESHLWMAAYLDEIPKPPRPWASVAMWQYQGGGNGLAERFVGKLPGVVGACDRSRLLVPIETLRV